MTRNIAPEEQAAIATARFIRISPTKARQVVDLIRGRHVDDARRVLAFTQRSATTPVAKVLESAVANAEHNRGLPTDELVVARAWVDEGPTLRRFRPRAMGRATRIRKRTCHISVVVGRPVDLHDLAGRPSGEPARTRRSPNASAASETPNASATSASAAASRTTAQETTHKKTEEGDA